MAKKVKKFIQEYKEKNKISRTEPIFDENITIDEQKKILQWYRMKDYPLKTQKKWVIKFINNKDLVKDLEKVPEQFFHHPLSSMCRMISRGFTFSEKNQDFMSRKINDLTNYIKNEKSKSKSSKIDPIIEELDFFVDEFFANKNEHEIDTMLNEFKFTPLQIKTVSNKIEKYIKEYSELKNWAKGSEEDKEYFESYGISIQKINKFLKYFTKLLETCTDWKAIKVEKKKRAPRKKKIKTPEQICKKVKISETTPVPATSLLKSTATVILDEKKGKLFYLVAEEEKQFEIKGTTILNIDSKKSFVFTVKKKFRDNFKEIFTKKMRLNRLKKIFEGKEFRLTKTTPKGRLSEDKIILTIA
jgi:hypothetical protein